MAEEPAFADLHRHLDGSLRPSTLDALARERGVTLPDEMRFFIGMGLQAALDRFAITLAVLQEPEAVARVAAEICEDAAADRVQTLEIRFAPHLHRGAPPERIVEAALAGVAGRAGLILCGLYGDPPDVLEELVDIAADRTGVVAIDLAGGPTPAHGFRMSHYAPAFSRARDLGIGRTVHAGEGRPPAEIREAVVDLHAQRIGHGTTLLDDEAVAKLVVDRGVTIEACPTSNVQTGVIPNVAAHPLVKWLKRGVKACVCTDNTFFSDVTSSSEHRAVMDIPGMTPELLERAVQHGQEAAFRRA